MHMTRTMRCKLAVPEVFEIEDEKDGDESEEGSDVEDDDEEMIDDSKEIADLVGDAPPQLKLSTRRARASPPAKGAKTALTSQSKPDAATSFDLDADTPSTLACASTLLPVEVIVSRFVTPDAATDPDDSIEAALSPPRPAKVLKFHPAASPPPQSQSVVDESDLEEADFAVA
jgi:hypothetical protein